MVRLKMAYRMEMTDMSAQHLIEDPFEAEDVSVANDFGKLTF